ncbi:MAG: hypothetical protein JXA07_06580, partial [Spirochaetes bacterium]|nr:hypothetical protein [Spirochaetota bacterium]
MKKIVMPLLIAVFASTSCMRGGIYENKSKDNLLSFLNIFSSYDATITSSAVSGQTNLPSIPITITFDEPVTGFDITDITVSGATISGFTQLDPYTYEFTITPTGDGLITVEVADAAALKPDGEPTGPVEPFSFISDTTAPAGYAAYIDQTTINSTNQTGLSFNYSAAEIGAAYNFSVTDGTLTLSGTGTVSAATGTVSGINVSSLGEGTLTLSFTLTDAAGNAGTAATDTVDKDTLAPIGYTASIDQANINTANQTALSFTYAAAEVGSTYSYRISGSSGSVPGSGTIAAAGDTLTGIDVSSLPDGTLTLSFTLTDAAGNTGTAATDTILKDSTAPSGYSASIDQVSINTGNATAISFTFSGAEIGSTYDFSVTDGTGTVSGNGTVSAANQQITGIDVTGLIDGLVSLNVTLTDTSGNAGTAVTDTVTKDTVAPTVAITSTATDPTGISPIPVTITFSESVNGVAIGDITVGNGIASNLTGGPAVYTAEIIPTTYGAVTVDISAGTAQDSAGNTNAAAPQFSITYGDIVPPTVAITSTATDPTGASPIPITITFSEDVTGFSLSDITVGNGSAANLAGGPAIYTADITPTTYGTVTVDIGASVAYDGAANPNTAAPQFS